MWMWGKRKLFAPLVGMHLGAATVESIMELPRKLKMELPCDPMFSLLGIHPKKPETVIQNNIYIFMFIAVLFTISKI